MPRYRLTGLLAVTAGLFIGCAQLQQGAYDPGSPTINGQAVEEVPPGETDDPFIQENTVELEGCNQELAVYWGGLIDVAREGRIYTFSTAETNGADGMQMLAEGAFMTGGDTWSMETAKDGCPIREETDFEGEITSSSSMKFFELKTWTQLDEDDPDCWFSGDSCSFEVGWELVLVES